MSEQSKCPTCGTPAVLKEGHMDNPMENWKPIGLDALEREVVEEVMKKREEHELTGLWPAVCALLAARAAQEATGG